MKYTFLVVLIFLFYSCKFEKENYSGTYRISQVYQGDTLEQQKLILTSNGEFVCDSVKDFPLRIGLWRRVQKIEDYDFEFITEDNNDTMHALLASYAVSAHDKKTPIISFNFNKNIDFIKISNDEKIKISTKEKLTKLKERYVKFVTKNESISRSNGKILSKVFLFWLLFVMVILGLPLRISIMIFRLIFAKKKEKKTSLLLSVIFFVILSYFFIEIKILQVFDVFTNFYIMAFCIILLFLLIKLIEKKILKNI